MKNNFLIIVIWALLSLLPVTANAVNSVLLSDNFDDGIISASWTVTGDTIQEVDGVLKILQNTTDAGGVVTSVPFNLPEGLLTLTRKAKLHYANNFAMPSINLVYRDELNVKQNLFSIYYGNMSYDGHPHQSVYGTFLALGSSSPHSRTTRDMTIEGPPVLWDSWFDERITYDQATGEVRYYRNGVEEIVGTAPIISADTPVWLTMNAWGWFTDHSHYIDDLEITANNVDSTLSKDFLSFPLLCADINCGSPYSQGAYTLERITSVLDHHMDIPYDKDGEVQAFNGEKGKGQIPSTPSPCYPKVGGGSFSVSGLYVGTDDGCLADQGLNYDNHPGHDYKASLGTRVNAAASGTVLDDKCLPIGISSCDAWGYVGIDHGNGYITQYGHLSRIDVSPGDIVDEGDQIGLSGDKGVEGSPHLHFEVLRKNDDKPGYAFVDPYGWEGSGNDLLAEINGIENVRLWKYDPRECLLNWAELSFNQLFSPIETGTETLHPFNYRYYQITNSYLGVSSIDNHVYYVGPDNVLQNVGDLSHWLSVAGCHN